MHETCFAVHVDRGVRWVLLKPETVQVTSVLNGVMTETLPYPHNPKGTINELL